MERFVSHFNSFEVSKEKERFMSTGEGIEITSDKKQWEDAKKKLQERYQELNERKNS